MNKNQIIADLTAFINKARQPSDFQIASTVVRFSDLTMSDKLSLHQLIAKKKVS